MDNEQDYLKYIYNEELYIIDEPDPVQNVDELVAGKAQNKNISVEDSEPASLVQEPNPVSYLGNNEKGILILVNDAGDELLNQKDLDLLMKIIESGLKFSKNDIALVNTANNSFEQILDEVSYSYLISFGVDVTGSFTETSLYTVHRLENSMILLSESLSSMHDDKIKKGKLWQSLKSMFKIS